jgi:hypothetical protein
VKDFIPVAVFATTPPAARASVFPGQERREFIAVAKEPRQTISLLPAAAAYSRQANASDRIGVDSACACKGSAPSMTALASGGGFLVQQYPSAQPLMRGRVRACDYERKTLGTAA